MRPRFANILLAGRCNLRCPACIGRRLAAAPASMERFPLPGLERFLRVVRRLGIEEIALTGIDAEPQLYPFEAELQDAVRAGAPRARLSLHTNGTLLLRRLALVHRYDRVCVSYPSFDPETYRRRTGGGRPYSLRPVLERVRIPLKISTLLDDENLAEVPVLLRRCRDLGVRRLVLRCRDGWSSPADLLAALPRRGSFGGNPVHDFEGMEVTLWDFQRADLGCLNLFSDGRLGSEYRLDRALRPRAGEAAAR